MTHAYKTANIFLLWSQYGFLAGLNILGLRGAIKRQFTYTYKHERQRGRPRNTWVARCSSTSIQLQTLHETRGCSQSSRECDCYNFNFSWLAPAETVLPLASVVYLICDCKFQLDSSSLSFSFSLSLFATFFLKTLSLDNNKKSQFQRRNQSNSCSKVGLYTAWKFAWQAKILKVGLFKCEYK